MADITKCLNTLCPQAGMCWRHRAPDSNWQSYAMFQYTVSEHGVVCDHYWDAYKYHATAHTVTHSND